ncbi:CYTH domain-containing protein [Amycolatopsis sp. SID8362]|uniref:CYTH domain-containing protein n=1 Tax=Amycolatopsis sp. SID8362 TaxID=2690346 RepID=UPI00136CB79B|nr:CYTH domain-containing protein [Amycolatopsis sp. SID8362]NBH09705.1 CYTH domain-containing protein [Amycolatopsis sp. SID8362]NED46398.1 CYTH domain-containing protein [Amycolatopsis sp. SID8362]
MYVEREWRFRLSEDKYRRLAREFEWSPPVRVVDVTLGLDGPVSMKTRGWVARLRWVEGVCALQYKGLTAGENEYLEAEVGVETVRGAAEVLSLMGLRLGLVIDRTRRTARVRDAVLTLDDVAGLGMFLEVELSGRAADQELSALVAEFGLGESCPAYGDQILAGVGSSPAWADSYVRAKAAVLTELGLERVLAVEDVVQPTPS